MVPTASLRTFVGRHHARLLDAPERLHELDGTLVFADVSGFTALNERLARRGSEGAELMVALLDAVFGAVIDEASSYGGDLLKFGGDAVLLLFDGPDHVRRAGATAASILAGLRRRTDAHRAIGRLSIGMSIGMESGPVCLQLAGAEHPELLVSGPALDATLAMETAAERGQLLAGPVAAGRGSLPGRLHEGGLLVDLRAMRGAGVARRPAVSTDVRDPGRGIAPPLRAFLADPEHSPEHRRVATAFVRFPIRDDAGRPVDLDELTTLAQQACLRHGATFVTADVVPGGGKFVVVVGAPTSLGDNVDRALELGVDLVRSSPVPVAVGINEGVVFCGEIGSAERRVYAVIGDPVNLAARVAAHADWGEVLCEARTLTTARSPHDASPVAPFAAKGKAELVQASRVARSVPAEAPPAELDLLGRDRELDLIVDSWAATGPGRTTLLEVTAPAGTGKSTLLAAAAERCGGALLHVVGGRYLRFEDHAAVAAALSVACGRALDGATLDGGALVALLRSVRDDLATWAPLVAPLVGVDVPPNPQVDAIDPALRAVRLHLTVAELLRGLGGDRFLVVVDDAQWLDPPSADLLHHLAADPAGGVLLIVARRPVPGGLRLDDATAVELGPLDDDAAAGVVRRLAPDLDPHAVRQVVERSSGVPLFLEVLATAAAAGADDQLPATVDDALRAELDRAPVGARTIVGVAAVLGREADLDLLARVSERPRDEVMDFLRAAPGFTSDDGARFRFRHPLRQEVAYAALPHARRRATHRAAAASLVEADDPPAALVSLHLHRSGDRAGAWAWSLRAAARTESPTTRVELLERALASATHLPAVTRRDRAQVLEDLGDANEVLGRFGEAERRYREAMRIDREPVATARRATKTARACELQADLSRGLRWCRRAERAADDLPAATLAFATRVRAAIHFRRGELEPALVAYREAAALARRGRDRRLLATALKGEGTVLELLGEDGVRPLARAVELFERDRDERGAATARINLGAALYDQGRWDEAARAYARAGREAERIGDLVLAATADNNLAEIRSDRGDLEGARPLFGDALASWRAFRYAIGVGVALGNLGRLERRAGRFEDARRHLDEARAAFVQMAAHDFVAEVDLRLAELELAGGDLAAAREALVRCEGPIRSGEAGTALAVGVLRLGAVAAHRRGEDDRADELLARAAALAAEHRLGYEGALVAEACALIGHGAFDVAERALERMRIVDSGQRQLLAGPVRTS